jgi:alkylmercury lyase
VQIQSELGMTMSVLEETKLAWASDFAGLSERETDARVRGFTEIVRAIAIEGTLSPDGFAARMGLEAAQATELFSGLKAFGMQVDAEGNIVGAALTTLETPHRVRFDGKDLFAWCALDTLFIPGLLGKTVAVESTCPSSGETVRLSVSPDRIESVEPDGVWLSVFVPGGASRQVGPASPT